MVRTAVFAGLGLLVSGCGVGDPVPDADVGDVGDVTDGDSDTTGTEGTGEESSDTVDQETLEEIDGLSAELLMIANGAIGYFAQGPGDGGPHGCPYPAGNQTGGESGITPQIGLDCSVGPDGHCVPAVGGGGAGYYDIAEWYDNPVWSGVGFVKTEAHHFHYYLIAVNDVDGYGACQFTAQAFGDLDGDTLFSTYALQGSVDENGSFVDQLFIASPYE